MRTWGHWDWAPKLGRGGPVGPGIGFVNKILTPIYLDWFWAVLEPGLSHDPLTLACGSISEHVGASLWFIGAAWARTRAQPRR